MVEVERGCLEHKRQRTTADKGEGPLICACDPGVKTLAAVVAPGVGLQALWGTDKMVRFNEFLHEIDAINRVADEANSRTRYHLRHGRIARLWKQLHNMVGELHLKLCHWLCQNFDVILWPEFAVSEMMKRFPSRGGRRAMSSDTTRHMQTWSFSKLEKTLFLKAKEYGVQVVRVSEAYTTQFCVCGHREHHSLGERQITCPQCDLFDVDRDIRSAYSVYLCFLTTVNDLGLMDEEKKKQPTSALVLSRDSYIPHGSVTITGGSIHS